MNFGKALEELKNGNKHDYVPPFICMKTADKNVVFGWLASQTDMLAEDWKIIR